MSSLEQQRQNVALESAGCESLERRKTQFITKSQIAEYLKYDPFTGLFTAIKSHGTRWKIGSIVGHKNNSGYVTISLKGKLRKAHRMAWIYMYDVDIDGFQIDHINGNKSDNRISNLRISTHQQNMFNMKKKKTNKSGVKGVHFDNRCNKWRAQTSINKKRVHLGLFDSIRDAERVIYEFMNKNHNDFMNIG